MRVSTNRGGRWPYAALFAAGAVALVWAWRRTWFLTDDAFIVFRYLSNARLGFGYVWNPPPFRPVEGYSSALWLLLLDVAWRGLGVLPTRAANLLALACSLGTLALTLRLSARLALTPALARWRLALAALVLLGTVTNSTFVVWSSGGLDTALFDVCWMAWFVTAWSWRRERASDPLWLSATAVLTELARPEGLLAVGSTVLLLVTDRARAPRARRWRPWALLAVVPAQLAWRRARYGAWLPNPYAAKYVAPWPACGVRYLASFIVEYGLAPLLVLCVVAAVVAVRARRRAGRRLLGEDVRAPALATATLVAQLGAFTWLVGGDHFEYRPYAIVVPLLFPAAVAALSTLGVRPSRALPAIALLVLLSWPLPWLKWTLNAPSRARSDADPPADVAPYLPRLARPYGAAFDALQRWLNARGACVRYADHRDFLLGQMASLPSREAGEQVRGDLPVMHGFAVGYLGWVLPHVAIIDHFGLNDFVVARTPPRRAPRFIAHERDPPRGYVACFRPNVEIQGGRAILYPRALDEETVRECERRFAAALR